jgi:Dynamin family
MTTGYEAAKQAGERLAQTLSEIATLIGPAGESVTLRTGEAIQPGLGFREDAAALAHRARDMRQGLFTIIVLGEFKNGKSTLLNGMLGHKTLPAKAAPATAIITVLVYGNRPEVAIHEAGKSEPRMMSWEDFVREFQLSREDQETLQQQGSIDRFAYVEYAEVEVRHSICAHGVKLIDSPGLGEHISRTRVATNFLKRSQAVIMVLNATRILTQEERSFIDTILGQGRLNHVFFVVNRINQVDPESVNDIRSWVRERLSDHFTSADGSFDTDLYDRRVFFVDAKGALDARSIVPHDETRADASGVPALEQELERFLATDDKIAAASQSTAQFIGPVIVQAERRIGHTMSALDKPLDELERRRVDAERRLQGLEGRKREIERTILLFGDTIKRKVYADLRTFVERMHETWDADSRRLMDLEKVLSIKSVITAYTQQEARKQLAVTIAEEIQRYVQAKFGEWADRIPSVIHHDVEVMEGELEAQVGDFQAELDEIAGVFAGTLPSRGGERAAGARLIDIALTVGDISGMTDSVMGIGDWSGMVGRMVQQAIIAFLVSTFFIGNFMVALLIVEAIHIGVHESEIKRKMRQTLGDRLHERLTDQVRDRQAFVFSAIEERFQQLAARLSKVIEGQIEEVRTEQERIIGQKRDENFSVDAEKARLNTIGAELRSLYSSLQKAATLT